MRKWQTIKPVTRRWNYSLKSLQHWGTVCETQKLQKIKWDPFIFCKFYRWDKIYLKCVALLHCMWHDNACKHSIYPKFWVHCIFHFFSPALHDYASYTEQLNKRHLFIQSNMPTKCLNLFIYFFFSFRHSSVARGWIWLLSFSMSHNKFRHILMLKVVVRKKSGTEQGTVNIALNCVNSMKAFVDWIWSSFCSSSDYFNARLCFTRNALISELTRLNFKLTICRPNVYSFNEIIVVLCALYEKPFTELFGINRWSLRLNSVNLKFQFGWLGWCTLCSVHLCTVQPALFWVQHFNVNHLVKNSIKS